MKRLTLVILIFFITIPVAFSQELRIAVSAQPLDKVLKGLAVELSFDHQALSRYNATAHKTFHSPLEAIDFLLKDTPYTCQRIGSVYVISPKPREEQIALTIKPTYRIQGKISDALTGESLPFAYITSDKVTATSNTNGLFNLIISENKYSIKINDIFRSDVL